MLTVLPYTVIILIIIGGALRCVQDRNAKDKWKRWGQHLSGTIVIILFYLMIGLVIANIYVKKTDDVYTVYETVDLEAIKSTSQPPKPAELDDNKAHRAEATYLQGSWSTASDTTDFYFIVKTDGLRLKVNSANVTINYRETSHRMIVKSLRIKNSNLAKMLHIGDKLQTVSYQIYIPATGVDLATNPEQKDFELYVAP